MVVKKQLKTSATVHLSFPFTDFMAHFYQALSHSLSHTLCSHSASLIWNINLHFSQIYCKCTAHLCTDTPSVTLSKTLLFWVSVSLLIDEMVNIYATVKEAQAELETSHLSLLAAVSLCQRTNAMQVLQQQKMEVK